MQYAKLRMLELYHDFFSQNVAIETNMRKGNWIQILSLRFAEKGMYSCIREGKWPEKTRRSKDWDDIFSADSCPNFNRRTVSGKHKRNTQEKSWTVQGRVPLI